MFNPELVKELQTIFMEDYNEQLDIDEVEEIGESLIETFEVLRKMDIETKN